MDNMQEKIMELIKEANEEQLELILIYIAALLYR